MAKDWSSTVSLVNRLLTKFGRSITLLKDDRQPDNPAEEWEGPPEWDDATASTSDKLDDVKAVFVGVSESEFADITDGLIRRGKDGFLIAGDAGDLSGFNRVDDSGSLWSISRLTPLKPGDTVLLWGVEVER